MLDAEEYSLSVDLENAVYWASTPQQACQMLCVLLDEQGMENLLDKIS